MKMRRHELEQQLASRTEELLALNEITAAVNQSLDLNETLNQALEKILQVMKIDQGGIYLRDDRNGDLKIAAQRGFSPEFIEKIDGLQRGEGFSGHVLQSGEPLVIKDLTRDAWLTRRVVEKAGFRSVAVVPLKSKGSTLGTLFIVTIGQREFTNDEIELLTSIGHQLGVAIENARLYEDTKKRLAQLAALQETNRALEGTLELDALLNLIVQQATDLLQADGGILNLADWEKMEDEVVASAGSMECFFGIRLSLDLSLSGWVTLHGQPLISNNVNEDPRAAHRLMDELLGYVPQNAAVAPLTIKDKIFGTLVVADKLGGAADFDQPDLDLLVGFANQAATAIENARLYTDERRRAEQFRAVSEVSRRLTLILDVDEILKQIIRVIQETFGYYHVGIGLIEGDELVYRVGSGVLWDDPDFQFKPARLKVGMEGISGWVAATGQPLIVPDVEKEPRYVCMQGSATRSELTVPVFIKEAVVGVLDAQSEKLNAFDETDLVVLQTLAHQAGAAIENARLYERAQKLAVLEERNRLARELHDAVTQTLFSASLLAEALPTAWENDPQEGRHLLQELRGLSRGALAEMRTLLLELRPAALVETRLKDLLRQLGEAASGREGIPVTVLIEGQGDLPPDVHIALYRIAQEALNNVVKHSRANAVKMRLCYTCTELDSPGRAPGQSILLSICDDGRGFDLNRVPLDRLGIGIMHERAQAIGATLTIDSHPGEGTQVTLLWEEKRE
jgi:GAF domain-containing protein